MAEVIRRSKALAVNPLKTSQPMGAALAVLGLNQAMPVLHGAQGCSAFAKVFFVRHFHEPIPLQTTAMDPIASIMGADAHLIEALRTVCERARPAVVGLLTTGLSEAQGTDIRRLLKTFRRQCPQFQGVRIVAVNTPDFAGCLETGFAEAVRAMVDAWVPAAADCATRPGRRPRQVNVLAGAALTPGDLEAVKEIIGGFDLHPVVIPDISDSLDGHLSEAEFSPVTAGGTPVAAFAALGNAAATLVIGPSMRPAAALLHRRTGVPEHVFPHLLGLQAMDALLMTLAGISGRPIPARLRRQREQLQDTMLDTHFMLSQARIAIALEADLLNAFAGLLAELGAETVAAVAPERVPLLERLPLARVQIGDLEDLEVMARGAGAELVIGSSRAAQAAGRLGVPLLRAGFPLYDRLGAYQRTWIGYQGSRRTLFDLANHLLAGAHSEIEPYPSIYSRKSDPRQEAMDHELATASAPGEQRH